MKVRDLMIGDWVNLYGSPIKINIDDLGVIERDEIYDKGVHCGPIPLTPEILEKNDFKKHSGGGYIIKELTDDEIPTLYIWDGNDSLYVVDYYSANTYTYIKDCKYVHEFQHELKSCGIEKEIVL